jgi:hypothetical protein
VFAEVCWLFEAQESGVDGYCSQVNSHRNWLPSQDTKRDGQLSFEEFKAAISESGISESKHQEIFDAVVSIAFLVSRPFVYEYSVLLPIEQDHVLTHCVLYDAGHRRKR